MFVHKVVKPVCVCLCVCVCVCVLHVHLLLNFMELVINLYHELSISHPEMFNMHMGRSGTVKPRSFYYSNIYLLKNDFT
jgi:hypothetical protein